MRQSLLPITAADNGSACMSCMQSSQHLSNCAACKCVKYCGRACQRGDWSKHKPVCKLIQAFQQASKQMPDMPILGCKINIGNKFNRFQRLVTGEEEGVLEGLGVVLPATISNESWNRAKKLVIRSPCCAICKKSNYDFNAEELEWKCCPRCKYGWTCCAEHSEEYSASRHTPAICNSYIKASKIDLFRYMHTVNHGDRFMFIPEHPLRSAPPTFPRGWDGYFRLRCPGLTARGMLPEEFFPAATFLLSQVRECTFPCFSKLCCIQFLTYGMNSS